MLDVRRLRLLCDLAQLDTIAAVARSHTYTPSAVSQQLAALEREAGVPLLERTGRRVALTPAGVILVRHAETVLGALEAADAALATARGELSGPLRIGAFPTAVRPLLATALVTLGRDHPALELMVSELDPVAVAEALRERRLDVALVHDYDIMPVEPDDSLDAVPLLDETVFLAVPANDPDTDTDTDTDTDPVARARHAAWIAGSPGTACHAVALQVCRTAGFTPLVRITPTISPRCSPWWRRVSASRSYRSWPRRGHRPVCALSHSPSGVGPASPTGGARQAIRRWPRASPPSVPPPGTTSTSEQPRAVHRPVDSAAGQAGWRSSRLVL